MIRTNDTGIFPYTPATQLLRGLRVSLDMIAEEGMENIFARHHRLAEGVREAVEAWGLRLCAKERKWHSDTGQRHCRSRRDRQRGGRQARLLSVQASLWHRAQQGRRKGLPHRPSWLAERGHGRWCSVAGEDGAERLRCEAVGRFRYGRRRSSTSKTRSSRRQRRPAKAKAA